MSKRKGGTMEKGREKTKTKTGEKQDRSSERNRKSSDRMRTIYSANRTGKSSWRNSVQIK